MPAPVDLSSADPGAPYLFVDVFSRDLNGKPKWPVVPQTAGYVGAIVKAFEGTKFNDGGWFKRNWPVVRDVGGDRYGTSWFRGAYLFLKFNQDGAAQADAYLAAVEAVGGWESGDLVPIIDVEQGGATNSNRTTSAQQVIDCTTACANRLREQTDRKVMLYGRGAMRDLGIHDRMGCDMVWNPSWTETMVRNGLDVWPLEDIVLWQYCGDGDAAIKKLPHEVPGFGKVDISVYIQGAEKPTLTRLAQRLL